jgi:hypothetical protein
MLTPAAQSIKKTGPPVAFCAVWGFVCRPRDLWLIFRETRPEGMLIDTSTVS